LTGDDIRRLARECGFELAGVARAEPLPERAWYHEWVEAGYAGEMRYLAGRRADVRDDPRNLLPSAKTVVSVGKLYNTVGQPERPATGVLDLPHIAGWISR
jgi:epoxyqueuosine reductase